MSTLRLSIVTAAILAAASCTFAQTTEGPPTCCPDPSKVVDVQPARSQDEAAPAPKANFSLQGMFVDCCSCSPPCPCEVMTVAMGCRGVGVHHIDSGRYAGDDLFGVRIAHAKVVGEWVNLYIDAEDEKQRAAAEKFGRAAFAAFGPIKEVKAAEIEINGSEGKYTVTVDGGNVMRFETEAVLGGDRKTPIGYTNIKNAVNPVVYQGTCVSATYSDEDKKFTVEKGRNSHFNPKLKSSGNI